MQNPKVQRHKTNINIGWRIIIAAFLATFFHLMKMPIENHIHIRHYSSTSRKVGMQHSHFAISTNYLTKEQSAKAKLKCGTLHCLLKDAFRYSFGWNSWRTQTFFILTFLNRSHNSSLVTRFFRNWVCSFSCSKSVKIRTHSVLMLSTHSANFHTFPSFLRRQSMVELSHWSLRTTFWMLSFRPLSWLPKVPGRRNLMVDLFVFHLRGLYRQIWTSWTIFHLGFC